MTWNGIQHRRNSWQDGVLGTNCPIPVNWNWTYQFQVKDQIGSFSYFPSTGKLFARIVKAAKFQQDWYGDKECCSAALILIGLTEPVLPSSKLCYCVLDVCPLPTFIRHVQKFLLFNTSAYMVILAQVFFSNYRILVIVDLVEETFKDLLHGSSSQVHQKSVLKGLLQRMESPSTLVLISGVCASIDRQYLSIPSSTSWPTYRYRCSKLLVLFILLSLNQGILFKAGGYDLLYIFPMLFSLIVSAVNLGSQQTRESLVQIRTPHRTHLLTVSTIVAENCGFLLIHIAPCTHQAKFFCLSHMK